MTRFLLAILAALLLVPVALAGPEKHSNLGDDGFVGELRGDILAAPAPVAGVPSVKGCRTDFISHNFSSRGGVKPRLLVLHYTVSPNTEGWGDVNLIRGLFNRDSFNASSTTLVDFEGHCKYIVNESAKPWTQTFYNPWSISVEIIATGKEPKSAWLASKGLVKVAKVFAGAAARWDIPLRWVDPGSACVAPPAGITDHDSLDCQNSHTDVRPSFPYNKFMSLVKKFSRPEIRFEALDGEGGRLARTKPVPSGHKTEWPMFLDFWERIKSGQGIYGELRKDGDVVIRRKVEK